jgi:hypothetical protein
MEALDTKQTEVGSEESRIMIYTYGNTINIMYIQSQNAVTVLRILLTQWNLNKRALYCNDFEYIKMPEKY